MAEVTNGLMYELPKKIPNALSDARFDLQEIKRPMTGAEEALAGVNRRLGRHDEGLGHIERRLELHEFNESQASDRSE